MARDKKRNCSSYLKEQTMRNKRGRLCKKCKWEETIIHVGPKETTGMITIIVVIETMQIKDHTDKLRRSPKQRRGQRCQWLWIQIARYSSNSTRWYWYWSRNPWGYCPRTWRQAPQSDHRWPGSQWPSKSRTCNWQKSPFRPPWHRPAAGQQRPDREWPKRRTFECF